MPVLDACMCWHGGSLYRELFIHIGSFVGLLFVYYIVRVMKGRNGRLGYGMIWYVRVGIIRERERDR